jgi:hypothetical protein
MGTIRPCVTDDVAEVADLWARTFHLREPSMTDALAGYLQEIFFSNPWHSGNLPSLIHQDRSGRITGFLGVVPRRMRFRGQTIQVAVASQLMVDRNEPSAFTALEMLRRLFSGQQDLTFSDGANDLSQKLWEAAGGSMAIPFSLNWTRILRPAGYWAGQCRERKLFTPFVKVSGPIRKTLDAAAARIPGSPYMFPGSPDSHVELEPSNETVLECLHSMTRGRELQPHYDLPSLGWLLDKAKQQKKHGQLRASVVRNLKGEIVGSHFYYAKRGGVSQVLQVGGKDACFDDVLGSLFRDAWLQGATAISGQVDPRFARQLAKNHCGFTWTGGVLAHSRNRDIANAIHRGDAFLTRLDGEWWMRFCDMTEPSPAPKSIARDRERAITPRPEPPFNPETSRILNFEKARK